MSIFTRTKSKLEDPIVGPPPAGFRPTVVPADLVRGGDSGHYRRSRRRYLNENKRRSTWRRDVLAWLRDNVWEGLPRWYYQLTLGHDIHRSDEAELYVRHFHYGQADPFTGKLEYQAISGRGWCPGWWENVGRVSRGKVTVAFRSFEIAQLVAETSEYGDYKFHRPGLSTQAESNADTALITDAGLEATGTQVDADPIYRSVATVTADVTETWEEHSIRSQTGAAGGTMMDRSLISPNVSVILNDTVEFTYEITKNAEA